MIISIIIGFIVFVFIIYMPIYLYRIKNIEPTINVFEKFVNNDKGYPWSFDPIRKINFEKSLKKAQDNIEKR